MRYPIGEDEITRDSSLTKDLHADSLDVVEVSMELEDHCQFTVPQKLRFRELAEAWEDPTVADVIRDLRKAAKAA